LLGLLLHLYVFVFLEQQPEPELLPQNHYFQRWQQQQQVELLSLLEQPMEVD